MGFGVLMPDEPTSAHSKETTKERPRKRSLRLLVIIASIGVVAVVILAAILLGGFNLPSHHITAYGETLFITSHSSSGDVIDTNTTHIWAPSNDHYRVGSQVKWDESFHNGGSGVMNITSILCTTPGFTFVGSSPALPQTLPNTPTKEDGAISLTLTFDAPSTQYTGPLNYTIFYDHYGG
jgi:hypothetical protein